LSCDEAADLIAPCQCAGTCGFVHRNCLNRWRAIKQNPRSFTHCPNCAFEYRLKLERIEEKGSKFLGRKSKFRLLLVRDTAIAFAATQVFVLLAMGLVMMCDPNRVLAEKYQDVTDGNGYKRVYYGAGLILVFFIVGLFAITEFICPRNNCCSEVADDATCWWYWQPLNSRGGSGGGGGGSVSSTDCDCCGDCNCNGCDCDGDAAAVVLVIAVVIAVIIVLTGVIVAVFAGIYMLQRAIQRHQHVLQKKILAEEYVVLDRSEWLEHGAAMPAPSAPDMPLMERNFNNNSSLIAPEHHILYSEVGTQLTKDLDWTT
jgi:hypothetical protein